MADGRRPSVATRVLASPTPSPRTIGGLQRAIGNSAVARLVAAGGRGGTGRARSAALQRVHIDQTLPALAAFQPSGQTTPLHYQQGAGVQNVDYEMRLWDCNLPHAATRRAAILAEQAWLAANGDLIGGPNAGLIARVIRPVAPHAVGEETIAGRGFNTQIPAQHWPFMVRLISTYGAGNTPREMYVNFAQNKYGYVTRVVDGNRDFNMQVPADLMTGSMFFEDWDYFSSEHGVDPGGNRDVMAQGEAMASIHDTDDQTKVIAEGGRWQAVSAKAAAGGLTDQTRFYPLAPLAGGAWLPGDQVPFVTLAKLWISWNRFQRRWNIADNVLRTTLFNTPLLQSGTATIAALQGSANNHGI